MIPHDTEVVCTDLAGKEPHREEGISMMEISGSLCGVMVSILAWNARDMGAIPSLGTIFTIFITPTTILCLSDSPVN